MLRGMLEFSAMIRVPQLPLNSQTLRRHTDVSKHTSVLYHFTSVLDAVSILQQKQFKLTFAGNESEARHQQGYDYYLSTTRSKVGRYTVHESYWQGVVFTLNAAWFSHKYKIKPIDYWGRSFDGDRESEDRVISNKPTMPLDMKQAILSIHIYIKDQKEDAKLGNFVRKIIMQAKLNKIPVHVYGDKTAFLTQNTKKATPLNQIQNYLNRKPDEDGISGSRHNDYKEKSAKRDLAPYMELLYKKATKHLSPQARSALYNLRYPDAIHGVQARIHNSKKSLEIRKLATAMRAEKIATPQELVERLRKKWDAIQSEEHKAEMKVWKANKKRKLIEKHLAKKRGEGQ
jgi:hypothetical protein